MSALVIGVAERAAIARLRFLASANPLEGRLAKEAYTYHPDEFRELMRGYSLELPIGYQVTYTHVQHPFPRVTDALATFQQISVSVARGGSWLPSLEAMGMILAEFGMGPLDGSTHVFIEQVTPDLKAVNVVQRVEHPALH